MLNSVYYTINNVVHLIGGEYSIWNKFKLSLTFCRLTFKKISLNKILMIRNEKIFGFKIHAPDYETIYYLFNEIFIRGEYFFKTKNKNPIILDCGANIGIATIFFKWLYPDSRIYAFEPDKEVFWLLKKNVEENNMKNVEIYNYAISDKDGKINLYTYKKLMGSLIASTKSFDASNSTNLADCISLSKFIKTKIKVNQIDFVKIDIEGSELEVIKELYDSGILKRIKELVIEYHYNHGSKIDLFLEILSGVGFEYYIDEEKIFNIPYSKLQNKLFHIYKKD